jgi:hypothetical protein
VAAEVFVAGAVAEVDVDDELHPINPAHNTATSVAVNPTKDRRWPKLDEDSVTKFSAGIDQAPFASSGTWGAETLRRLPSAGKSNRDAEVSAVRTTSGKQAWIGLRPLTVLSLPSKKPVNMLDVTVE